MGKATLPKTTRRYKQKQKESYLVSGRSPKRAGGIQRRQVDGAVVSGAESKTIGSNSGSGLDGRRRVDRSSTLQSRISCFEETQQQQFMNINELQSGVADKSKQTGLSATPGLLTNKEKEGTYQWEWEQQLEWELQ